VAELVIYDDRIGLGPLKNTTLVTVGNGNVVLVPIALLTASSDEAEFTAAVARGVAHVLF
jgi:hypothetical protein